MKCIVLITLLFTIFTTSVFSQKLLKGKVSDAATHAPLSGATIVLSGKSATTTADGTFSIECGSPSDIEVSYVGYQTYSRAVKNCDVEMIIDLDLNSRNLNGVEISATSNVNKSILYQPASIAKLSLLELKRGSGLFMDDAINGNVPGVTMNKRTVSGGQQFNIRGYGNGARGTRGISSNFDGQGYKVYLNGIPVTDAEGITTMDDIDFGSIGNVEITKGPAGTLYGLAIAGAVNLKTIKPEKGKTSVGQDVLIGNYGLQRYTTHFQMGGDHSSLLLNYGNQKSDGYTIHNKSHKDFVNIAGDFQLNDNQQINTYFGYSNSYDERFGELTLTQYETKDYSGNPDYIKRNAHSNVITFRAGVGQTYNFSKNVANTTTIFGTGFTSNVSSAGGWTDKNTINYGLRSTFDTKFWVGTSSILSGITGVEAQRQDGQTIGYSMKQSPNDTSTVSGWDMTKPYWVINSSTSNNTTANSTYSVFTEWTLALPQDFSITAGVGLSNMKITLNDRFNTETATRPTKYSKVYSGMASPHIAINKIFGKQFSAYASYSKGYKAPVSSYFFITTPAVGSANLPVTSRVNDNLVPEIGNQFEVGTKGNSLNNKLTYQLAVFMATFSNKMTAVAVPLNSTTTMYSYVVNGGKQDHKGLEVLAKYTVYESANGFFSSIRPYANLAYSDFKYKEFTYQTVGKSKVTPSLDSAITTVFSGQRVAAVAKITANIGIDIMTKPGVYATINHLYNDGVPITSDGVNQSPSYNLLNAKLGFQKSLSKHFDMDLYVGATNITDTQYPFMIFANQLPDAYLPAPQKANYFGGVNLKYNF